MDDKKRIREELMNIFFELKLSKTTEERKIELRRKRKELDDEYKRVIMDEMKKTK